MKNKKLRIMCLTAVLTAVLTSCGSVSPEDFELSGSGEMTKAETSDSIEVSGENAVLFKYENEENNPLITNIFCADPTAVEYNGRLYVYGTNDNQQYLEKGNKDNTYEMIQSFVIISTEDMVNWRYEGEVNTKEVAPWIIASWAPSIVSREEADGKTHFYLYFSNSGAGVGVLTSTSPTGPWSDPLGEPLVYAGMEGLDGCPNPFDPGVCIDDNGTGWLSFGGGTAPDGSKFMPGVARIVKLGSDMLSFDSEFVKVAAPYFFEASELNYIGGKYLYTYNTSWEGRSEWDESLSDVPPTACSMAYMSSKTPLESDSWQYEDYYLKNPGELGMEFSNNHTHLHKFKDKYYLFYHTLTLQKERGITKGFRSLGVNEISVDEQNGVINVCEADRTGAAQIQKLDPYKIHQAEEVYLTDCDFEQSDGSIYAKCDNEKVIAVKGTDFGKGSTGFAARVKGSGTLEVRLDGIDGEKLAALKLDSDDFGVFYSNAEAEGEHDIFFVFDGEFCFDEWEFTNK